MADSANVTVAYLELISTLRDFTRSFQSIWRSLKSVWEACNLVGLSMYLCSLYALTVIYGTLGLLSTIAGYLCASYLSPQFTFLIKLYAQHGIRLYSLVAAVAFHGYLNPSKMTQFSNNAIIHFMMLQVHIFLNMLKTFSTRWIVDDSKAFITRIYCASVCLLYALFIVAYYNTSNMLSSYATQLFTVFFLMEVPNWAIFVFFGVDDVMSMRNIFSQMIITSYQAMISCMISLIFIGIMNDGYDPTEFANWWGLRLSVSTILYMKLSRFWTEFYLDRLCSLIVIFCRVSSIATGVKKDYELQMLSSRDMCSFCLEPLLEAPLVQLIRCQHFIHRHCLHSMLRCPNERMRHCLVCMAPFKSKKRRNRERLSARQSSERGIGSRGGVERGGGPNTVQGGEREVEEVSGVRRDGDGGEVSGHVEDCCSVKEPRENNLVDAHITAGSVNMQNSAVASELPTMESISPLSDTKPVVLETPTAVAATGLTQGAECCCCRSGTVVVRTQHT